ATLPALWFTTLVVCAVTNSIACAVTALAVCEVVAWFVEAEAYRRAAGVARRHAMLISAAANGVSFIAGVLLGN
ncbi:MAG TPA: hypothetical protein PLV92_20055, partial [Pirellulaceae bacterium]|nr:hypothetical protein [Pirellulaceae bacterium]